MAALRGTRQVAFAVIATTTVLIAAFVPASFIEGNNGRLFRELAYSLAAAVAISAFVALTLTPMMCSLLLRPHAATSGFRGARRCRAGRHFRQLPTNAGTRHRPPVALGTADARRTRPKRNGLAQWVPRELAPPEDRGAFFRRWSGRGRGLRLHRDPGARGRRSCCCATPAKASRSSASTSACPGRLRAPARKCIPARVSWSSWDQRTLFTAAVVDRVRATWLPLPCAASRRSARDARSQGQPFQLVISKWSRRCRTGGLARPPADAHGEEPAPVCAAIDSDFKETRPQIRVAVDRERAAALGVSLADIGRTLETMMGSRRVTTYVEDGEEYDVVLQARRDDRAQPADLQNLYVRARSGQLVPLASVVTLSELAEPGSLNRFNRLR